MIENHLNLTEGSDDMEDINTLIDRGVTVEYEPQRDPETTTLESNYPDEDRKHQLKREELFDKQYK